VSRFPHAATTAPSPLIGGLLRLPATAIQRRLIVELNNAGFEGLSLPHMGVLQYPGPHGYRPIEIADRAGMSKQAMNQLLQSLERLGYIQRGPAESAGRARIVRFTERGAAAWDKMCEVLLEIEAEWEATLGAERFTLLKEILTEVWTSDLATVPTAISKAAQEDC
jgi:DNA-binding MarR family transcriptional regulator